MYQDEKKIIKYPQLLLSQNEIDDTIFLGKMSHK